MAVVLMAFMGAGFVILFSRIAHQRLEVVYQAQAYTPLCEWLYARGFMGFVIPVFTMLFGAFAILKKSALAFEIAIAVGLVATVAWILVCLLAWQFMLIPIFSGMKWHY